jgi:hypothetical protein
MRRIAIVAACVALVACGLDDKFKGAAGGDDMAVGGTDDMEVQGNDISGFMPPDFSGQAPADLSTISADLSGPFTWTPNTTVTGNFNVGFALARNNVYIAGDGNLLLHSSGDGTWSTPIDTGVSGGKWQAIWGDRATGDLWLCGYNATPAAVIVHTKDGAHFNTETQSTSLGSSCLALWGSSATDLYASGNAGNGLLVHSTGGGVWGTAIGGLQPLPSPVHFWLGMGASSSNNWFFVGGPDIYSYKGSGGINREYQNTPTTIVFHSVFAVSPTDIYVGTDTGIYYSTGNGSWALQASGMTITRIWGSGPTDIYGALGGIYHSTGNGSWDAVSGTGVSSPGGVFGFDKDDVYVFGNNVISHGHR